MATALRGHLLGAFFLLGVIGFWAHKGAAVPAPGDRVESLQPDLEALISGTLPADVVPALAQWVRRDSGRPAEQRIQVLSASVDAQLRHRIRLPARAEEDPLALLALALEPGLRAQVQADCPALPVSLSVLCDAEEWSLFEQSVARALLELMDSPADFAAANRVGGNDLALQAADALCAMGEQGAGLARRQVREARTERGAVLGVLALGCAGARELDPQVLHEWMKHPSSPGIRIAARLECAARPSCLLPDTEREPTTAVEALSSFAVQIQGGTP